MIKKKQIKRENYLEKSVLYLDFLPSSVKRVLTIPTLQSVAIRLN